MGASTWRFFPCSFAKFGRFSSLGRFGPHFSATDAEGYGWQDSFSIPAYQGMRQPDMRSALYLHAENRESPPGFSTLSPQERKQNDILALQRRFCRF